MAAVGFAVLVGGGMQTYLLLVEGAAQTPPGIGGRWVRR